MFFASKKSDKKIVHYDFCNYAKRISKGNLIRFTSLEEARLEGYVLCNCCAPIKKYIVKEQRAIMQFSYENGISCFQHDGELHVRTPRSKWKIIVNGKSRNIFLYHKNTKKRETSSMIEGYHSQCVRSNHILGYLEYIVEHDLYRKANPLPTWKSEKEPPRKGTKRWHKEEKKRKERARKRNIARVYSLIESLQEAHSYG